MTEVYNLEIADIKKRNTFITSISVHTQEGLQYSEALRCLA